MPFMRRHHPAEQQNHEGDKEDQVFRRRQFHADLDREGDVDWELGGVEAVGEADGCASAM